MFSCYLITTPLACYTINNTPLMHIHIQLIQYSHHDFLFKTLPFQTTNRWRAFPKILVCYDWKWLTKIEKSRDYSINHSVGNTHWFPFSICRRPFNFLILRISICVSCLLVLTKLSYYSDVNIIDAGLAFYWIIQWNIFICKHLLTAIFTFISIFFWRQSIFIYNMYIMTRHYGV